MKEIALRIGITLDISLYPVHHTNVMSLKRGRVNLNLFSDEMRCVDAMITRHYFSNFGGEMIKGKDEIL